jgi:uncharacterized protein (TIGR04255 family)
LPLAVSPQPRRLYRQNPLKAVICQLRYPVTLAFDQPGFLGPLQQRLKQRYPRAMAEQQIGLTLSPGGAAPIPPSQLWRFRSDDETWSVVLARDFAALETTAYERYEQFGERLDELFVALSTIDVTNQERLGLRYVNEFRMPEASRPSAWRDYLNPDLLGMVGGDVLGEDVIHAIEDIRVRQSDGVLVLRHGFVGAELAAGDPHYVLDFDYFDDQPKEFHNEKALAQVGGYHRTVHDVFELSITDPMRDHLGIAEVINA